MEEVRRKIVKEFRVNQQIKAKEVRVIAESGAHLGIMPLAQALQVAKEHGLDLVEVVPVAVPPVCRLLNYGKYKYEQAKKERELRKSQKTGLLKEIRLGLRIKEYDLEAKTRTIKKLLEDGNKVRVSLIFKGREVIYPERGWKILKKVVEELKGVAVVEGSPVMDEEKGMSVTLAPLSVKK